MVHNHQVDRDEISADEQGYTVPEWTVMKSQQMNEAFIAKLQRTRSQFLQEYVLS